jgi:hypothetical protein
MVYSRFCNKWIKRVGNRSRYDNPPPDIDLQPVRDSEDESTLRRIKAPRSSKRTTVRRGKKSSA